MADSDQALMAYAVLAEDFERTGDIASGLTRVFQPILAGKQGTAFDKDTIAKDLSKVFGIEVHPYAIDYFAPILQREGLIRESNRTGKFVEYEVADVPSVEEPVSVEKITELLQGFCDFATPKLKAARAPIPTAEHLRDAFLDRCRKTEFLGLFANAADGEPKADDKLDLLAAQYVLHLNDSEPERFNDILNLVSASLLAEVILNLQSPAPSTDNLRDLRVFLDGPLALDLLGLNNEAALPAYSRKLVHQLQECGAPVLIFPHTLDEIRNVIQTTLAEHEKGTGYGPLERLIRSDGSMIGYAKALLNSLPTTLREHGVTVASDTASLTDRQNTAFSRDEERELISAIMPDDLTGNIQRHERDGKSVATVMRLRAGSQVTRFTEAKCIFVTRNVLVASRSKQYIESIATDPSYFPPCISDRHAAGLLWICFGGASNSELTRLQLLANCSSITMPRKSVIERVYNLLSDIDEQKAKLFRGVMTDLRAENFVNEKALGDQELVTADNVEEYYEEALRVAASALEEEKRQALAKQQAQHEEEMRLTEAKRDESIGKLESRVQSLLGEKLEADTQLLSMKSSIAQLTEQQERLNGSVSEIQQEADARDKRILQRIARTHRKLLVGSEYVIALLLATLTGAMTLIPDSQTAKGAYIVFATATALSLINSLIAPDKFLGTCLRRLLWSAYVLPQSEKFELQLDRYLVDWVTGEVSDRKSEDANDR